MQTPPTNLGCRAGFALLGGVLLLALAGCADDPDTATAPQAGTISGTIDYLGPAVAPGRPLAIAVYGTFPPSGPPVAVRLVESYALPYAYRFEGLDPGVYYVGALVDVDRLDTRHVGMLNAARDPFAYAPGPVVLDTFEGAAGVDLVLEDAP